MYYRGKPKYCSICTQPNYETKMVRGALKTKLILKAKDNIEEFNLISQKTEKDSLQKLLEIIYGRSGLMAPITVKCDHSPLFKDLKKKLKCGDKKLKTLIESLIYDLGERSYQLDLLDKQLSIVTSRILRNGITEPNQQALTEEKEVGKKQDKVETRIKIEENNQQPINVMAQGSEKMCFVGFCFPGMMGSQLGVINSYKAD